MGVLDCIKVLFNFYTTTIFCPENGVCFLCMLHIIKCTSDMEANNMNLNRVLPYLGPYCLLPKDIQVSRREKQTKGADSRLLRLRVSYNSAVACDFQQCGILKSVAHTSHCSLLLSLNSKWTFGT